ncbi:hypothetical protein COCON_G00100310 [Conger conger]|uniref:G-protein coupled receptors family 1 profile domain-containing protein n=1 Tax=Conger conger TaxID=82655 RepID=A0A9Q1I122_CONCO|nr:hypothetical protein COCON_G00100310 [Conger conger]
MGDPMDDRYSSKLSPAVDYAAGAFLFLVALLTLLGNMLVLITAFKRRSQIKPAELLSVNLALTDLGAALSMYPMAIAASWSHGWVGGPPACRYYGMMGFLFGVASIATLTAMAGVRFIVCLSVQSPKEKLSLRGVWVLVACTWLYGLLWALLPLLGWGRYGPEPFGTSCSLAWGDLGDASGAFVFVMFSLVLVLPAAVIIACYSGLVLRLHRAYKTVHSRRLPSVIKTQRKLVLIAVLVSAGFLGSWAPYAAVSLWSVLQATPVPPSLALLPCLLAKSSTVVNPLVYYLFSHTFRRAVRNLPWTCWPADTLGGAEASPRTPPQEQNRGAERLELHSRADTEPAQADIHAYMHT